MRPSVSEHESNLRDAYEAGRLKGVYDGISRKSRVKMGGLPADQYTVSTETMKNGTVEMLVKNPDFKEVGSKPVSLGEALRNLSEHEDDPVSLGKNALDEKIIISNAASEMKLEKGFVPEPGMDVPQSGITLISAAVDYKVFKEQKVWSSFAEAKKIKFGADFKKENILILVSMSDFPNGIFSIKKVQKKSNGEIIVDYAVNPVIMSVGIEGEIRDSYAYATIPKNTKKIILRQVSP